MKTLSKTTRAVLLVASLWCARPVAMPAAPADVVQFVFTSDSHLGLMRSTFRGHARVPAAAVNEALVDAINRLPGAAVPKDGGIGAGTLVGAIDFVANGGDVANRAESGDGTPIQAAAASWAEFERIYLRGVHVANRAGGPAPVFAVPGNHDVSNAIGYHKPMTPATDATAAAGLYNLMMRPAAALSSVTYSYPRDRVMTTRDVGGVHFMFITIWPDSATRAWMAADLAAVPPATPVVVITHDQPDAEAKHFTNPAGRHDINATDKFENLLVDQFQDGTTADQPSLKEQASLEAFVAAHPNITAYLHGNSNWNQFYDWTGPGASIALHAFRVDSPMKGSASAADESRLSFQLATIDMTSRRMTVREVLWNAGAGAVLGWGGSTTVALSPRPLARREY